MRRHLSLTTATVAGVIALAGSAAQAQETCASAKRTFPGGDIGAFARREAPGTPIQAGAMLTLRSGDGPRNVWIAFENGAATPYLMTAILPVGALHEPVRSSSEQFVVTAPDGTRWKTAPLAMPLPHAPAPGERARNESATLASSRPGYPVDNPDLLARVAKGETLIVSRVGDEGEVFAALKLTPPAPAVRNRLYAEALAEATRKLAPCEPGPPLMIPPYKEPPPWPPLYLRPEDAGVLIRAPTLDEVGKITPAWGGGAVLGQAVVDCRADARGRLTECRAQQAQPAWIGQVSAAVANRITLAERLDDGRRTAGLALLLSMTWDKDAIRYAIAPPTGPAIPPPTPNAAPAP